MVSRMKESDFSRIIQAYRDRYGVDLSHSGDDLMTPYERGFLEKCAARGITSPEDLDALYKKLKYRVLNQKTNRPYFNTNFETFDNWHLLSPEQIKKHRIGICYDTAAMTDKVLKELGVEHSNYFAHSDKADGWENDPTHAFNVYKDENGDWRWLEGSWGQYKGNDWKERRKKKLVRKIVEALAEASGEKQRLHEVEEFPEPGIGMRDWYSEMLKNPVKKAEFEKRADPPNRGIHDPNPIKSDLYNEYGYIPQRPETYLGNANDEKTYEESLNFAVDSARKLADRLKSKRRINEFPAYWYDYHASRGDLVGQYNPGYGTVYLGSYPGNTEQVSKHELGHHKAHSLGINYGSDTLKEEEDAWDFSGVPAGDPVREALLDTYRYGYDKSKISREGLSLLSQADKDESSWPFFDRANNVLASNYIPPHVFAKNKKYDTPVVYDLDSALEGIRSGKIEDPGNLFILGDKMSDAYNIYRERADDAGREEDH